LGVVDRAIVMGGRTGGPEYGSESELIAKRMEAAGFPREFMGLETESKETLDNITNFLNLMDEGKLQFDVGNFNVLAVPYHAARVRMLLDLLQVPYKHVYVTDEVTRWLARTDLGMEPRPGDE